MPKINQKPISSARVSIESYLPEIPYWKGDLGETSHKLIQRKPPEAPFGGLSPIHSDSEIMASEFDLSIIEEISLFRLPVAAHNENSPISVSKTKSQPLLLGAPKKRDMESFVQKSMHYGLNKLKIAGISSTKVSHKNRRAMNEALSKDKRLRVNFRTYNKFNRFE